MQKAATQINALQQRTDVARDLPDADFVIPKLNLLNDLFDAFPFNVQRVGTRGGPSPIKQMIGVETTVYHQIETSRVSVEHLLSEVGLLHARLRRDAATASTATPR